MLYIVSVGFRRGRLRTDRGSCIMKIDVKKPPSRKDILQLMMAMCTREHLEKAARKKGMKVTPKMTKQDLCKALFA